MQSERKEKKTNEKTESGEQIYTNVKGIWCMLAADEAANFISVYRKRGNTKQDLDCNEKKCIHE